MILQYQLIKMEPTTYSNCIPIFKTITPSNNKYRTHKILKYDTVFPVP